MSRRRPADPPQPRRSGPRYDWQEDAACRGASIDLFFGPDGERPTVRRRREEAALQFCAGCPVLEQCFAHAAALPENHGVWGGTTESDRAERRRRSRVA